MSYVYVLNLPFFCGICNTCLMYFAFSLFRTKKAGENCALFSPAPDILIPFESLLLFFLLFYLFERRKIQRFRYMFHTFTAVYRSPDKGNIFYIQPGSQRICNLNDGMFSHSIGNQVCLGIQKDGTCQEVHFVSPDRTSNRNVPFSEDLPRYLPG